MSTSDEEDTDLPHAAHGGTEKPRSVLKRIGGSALAIIGFILSPISWWNDLLVNIPLAYLFAGLFTWVRPEWFNAAFIVGYLLTNVIGLLLMQYGLKHAAPAKKPVDFKKELRSSMAWSLAYTLLIVVLLLIGWIKPPLEYLQ